MRTEGLIADTLRLSRDSLKVEADRMSVLARKTKNVHMLWILANYAELFSDIAREIDHRLKAPK